MSGAFEIGARAMSSRLEFTAALCRFSGRADGQMIQ